MGDAWSQRKGGAGGIWSRRKSEAGYETGPPLGSAEGNNYRLTGGLGNLPGANMEYFTV